jgi:ATP-dependent DNA helicase RecQ
MVRKGKYQEGRFADELIQGCLEMLEQWNPEPAPRWITCVPSLTHPMLVPDFARRLAVKLKIAFIPCVFKVRENRPQKEMENSYTQAGNLDGVFEVDRSMVRLDPVLLIDDLCDSRWTMTVIAALLRQAGCSKVYPLALATALPRQTMENP